MWKKAEKKEGKTIGILGAGPGCGVTHFTILFANYLTAMELKRTAVLEWNGPGGIEELTAVCTGRSCGRSLKVTSCQDPVSALRQPAASAPCQPAVSILGVDYFPQSGAEELAFCLQNGYEAILMDFGSLKDGGTAEFLQCRMKCFLGALNEWKIREVAERREWLQKGRDNWNFLMVFGSEEARREMKRRYFLNFETVPFAPDAFSIDKEMAEFLGRIWTGKKRG
ncbi:MAG: hypothetical protein Q4F29_01380 [Lachnospiraceae bacterium]|nr:hypothetical protein [Lachnospiraceae bacterium]